MPHTPHVHLTVAAELFPHHLAHLWAPTCFEYSTATKGRLVNRSSTLTQSIIQGPDHDTQAKRGRRPPAKVSLDTGLKTPNLCLSNPKGLVQPMRPSGLPWECEYGGAVW